mmetsp:Transcript_68178/g.172508  ORF Transcript_68178/g.172508 Transcript_68178/m.172508 type:complete len:109 (+) Transcript_68178:1-327(+)
MGDLASMHKRGYGEAVTATELAVTAGQAIGPTFGALMQQLAGFNMLCLLLAAAAVLSGTGCAVCLRHVYDGGSSTSCSTGISEDAGSHSRAKSQSGECCRGLTEALGA